MGLWYDSGSFYDTNLKNLGFRLIYAHGMTLSLQTWSLASTGSRYDTNLMKHIDIDAWAHGID